MFHSVHAHKILCHAMVGDKVLWQKKHMKRHTDPFIGFMVGHRAPECVQLPPSLIKNRPVAALS